jgi:hypothetical protein
MLFRFFTGNSGQSRHRPTSDESGVGATSRPISKSNDDQELWYVRSAFDGSDENPGAAAIRMLKGALGLRG